MLIVRDTRESGEMLEASLAAGVAAGGGHALLGGVLPTPGAALLIRRYGFDLAAVVSASHNPYTDNGIKFFGPDGTKVSDELEARIEAVRRPATSRCRSPEPGRVRELHGAPGDYLRELELRFRDLDLSGTRVLLDCAQRRHLPRRARDLPPPRGRRRGHRRGARRAQHQRRRGLHPRRLARRRRRRGRLRRRASPSTATATACWRPTATARWWTATS